MRTMNGTMTQRHKTRTLDNVFFSLLLVIVFAAAFQLPRIVILELGLPLSTYFPYLPLLGPLCIVVLYTNAIYSRKIIGEGISFDQMDLFFVIGISGGIFLEIFHSISLHSEENFGLIFSYIWGYLFFRLLCTFDGGILYRNTTVDILIIFLTILSLWKLLTYFGLPSLTAADGFQIFRRQPVDALFLSEASYRAVLCIALVLFSTDIKRLLSARLAFCGIAVLINALLILANFNRGALLSATVLVILWIYKTKGLISILILAAAVVVIEIVSSVFFSSLGSNSFLFFEELLSFGRGFDLSEKSIEVRFQSSVLVIEEFLKNPLLGIGYAGLDEIRYEGYITHNHYLHTLVSYGVIGTIPFIMVLAIVLFRSTPIFSIEKLAYVFLFFMVLSVETYFRWWFGVIVFLIWNSAAPTRPSAAAPRALGSESTPQAPQAIGR